MSASPPSQQHQIHPNSLANLRPHPPWEPGKSPNPGGRPKDRPQTTVILDRFYGMSVEDLEAYQPVNAAEAACKLQVLNAAKGKALKALPSWKEITDRTEGKAPQRIEQNVTIGLNTETIQEFCRLFVSFCKAAPVEAVQIIEMIQAQPEQFEAAMLELREASL